MIVVQLSMTETIIANSTRQLIAQDEGLLEKYKALRNFQRRLECVSAWNKDPVFGVIGIQSGPRG